LKLEDSISAIADLGYEGVTSLVKIGDGRDCVKIRLKPELVIRDSCRIHAC